MVKTRFIFLLGLLGDHYLFGKNVRVIILKEKYKAIPNVLIRIRDEKKK